MNEIIKKIVDIGLLPVFFNDDVETSKEVVRACYEGGAEVVEFTNRGPQAFDVFRELVRWKREELPDLILGAGTILDAQTASLYINSGANFIVSPILNLEILRVCNRRGVPCIPGCMTPTEISLAKEGGAELIKLFPAKVVGADFIKTIRGPLPHVMLMPSGGVDVTKENIHEWIRAGASALNIGTKLIRKDLIREKRFDEIKKLVEQCILWIKDARTR